MKLVDGKAIYVANPTANNDPRRRTNLRASQGYGWLYILDSLAGNQLATSYDDTTDDALSIYRDVYDRRELSEIDTLRSMFRFLGIFTGLVLPNLETEITTSVTSSMQTKLNNVEFEFDLERNGAIPEINSKLWKFIYFMWLVQRGAMIRDADMFRLFDSFKPPVSIGLPVNRKNETRQSDMATSTQISTVLNPVSLPCILANTNNSLFADLDEINASFLAAAPSVADLDDSTASGVYLLRRAMIPKNKSILGVKTTKILRIVMDAYDTTSPVMDMRAMVALAPYQVIAQSVIHFFPPNRTGTIELKTGDILLVNKSADMSASASFYHMDYVSTSEPTMYLKIVDIVKATIKRNILVVDFEVDDGVGPSRTADFMTTPLITLADIETAEEYTVPADQLQTIRYPPVNTTGYTFTASTTWDNTVHRAAFAFDRNNATRWASTNGNFIPATGFPANNLRETVSSGTSYFGEWIQMGMPTARIFKSFGYRGWFGLHRYLICGSMDGVTWTTIHLRNTDHGLVRETDHTVTFNNNTAYFFYRLVILRGIPGQVNGEFSISELWFNEIAGSEFGYKREDIVMACKDPNMHVTISLNNYFRA